MGTTTLLWEEGRGRRKDIPAEGLEQAAAGTPVASGGASVEPRPPGKSEPGMKTDGGALVGEGPQAVTPRPVTGALSGPVEEAEGREGASLRPASC